MDQVSIYLVEQLAGYGTEIHRPPGEVKFEAYGAVVQWTNDETIIIPWSQIRYVTQAPI